MINSILFSKKKNQKICMHKHKPLYILNLKKNIFRF